MDVLEEHMYLTTNREEAVKNRNKDPYPGVGILGGIYNTQWEVGVKILKHLCARNLLHKFVHILKEKVHK